MAEHGQAVAHRERLLLVVGHVDEREPHLLLDLLQLDLHRLAELQVERPERLVQQQHLRPHDERPRERDALPLPARELQRLAVAELGEAHHLERLGRAGACARPSRPCGSSGRRRRSRPRSCAGTARSPGRPCSRRGRTAPAARRPAPPSQILPSVGCSNPAIIRRHVVLPEPDGPSIEKNSPSRTSRSTPSTAMTSPNRLTTPSSRTATPSCDARRLQRGRSDEPPPRVPVGGTGAHLDGARRWAATRRGAVSLEPARRRSGLEGWSIRDEPARSGRRSRAPRRSSPCTPGRSWRRPRGRPARPPAVKMPPHALTGSARSLPPHRRARSRASARSAGRRTARRVRSTSARPATGIVFAQVSAGRARPSGGRRAIASTPSRSLVASRTAAASRTRAPARGPRAPPSPRRRGRPGAPSPRSGCSRSARWRRRAAPADRAAAHDVLERLVGEATTQREVVRALCARASPRPRPRPGSAAPSRSRAPAARGRGRSAAAGCPRRGAQRDRAADDVAEPERAERPEPVARLVEAAGQPDRVRPAARRRPRSRAPGSATARADPAPTAAGAAEQSRAPRGGIAPGPARRTADARPRSYQPRCPARRSWPSRPIMLARRERRPGPPDGRGLRAARRVRAVLGRDLDRLLRQVPVPHPAGPAARRRRTRSPSCSRRAPSCSARRRAPRCCWSRPSRSRPACRSPWCASRPKAYGTRAQVEGEVAAGRGDDAARGRQHDGAPGAAGRGGPGRGRARTSRGSCSRSIAAAPTTCARRATTWTRSRCCGPTD